MCPPYLGPEVDVPRSGLWRHVNIASLRNGILYTANSPTLQISKIHYHHDNPLPVPKYLPTKKR
jgi:hypothetical protein